VTNIYGYQI
jgi:hypothetical protein